MTPIVDITKSVVVWAMDLAQLRQTVASKNIANAHASDYTAQKVDFSAQLASIADAGQDEHKLMTALQSVQRQGFTTRDDVAISLLNSTVAMDSQVAEITKNSLQYQSLVEGLNRKFGLMRLAIVGGRQG